jgi:hypothetical protein
MPTSAVETVLYLPGASGQPRWLSVVDFRDIPFRKIIPDELDRNVKREIINEKENSRERAPRNQDEQRNA